MTRQKERFEPREKNAVRIFTCGPSIYARPHIGNFRSFLYEDLLQRYLEYLGYRVRRMINFTDVEDKAIAMAKEKGLTLAELTGPNKEHFIQDTALLRIKLPARIPRASTSVKQAVKLIQELIDRGHAYWHEGDVFYDPLTFRGFGRLYGLDMRRWPKHKRRYRKDTYPGQRWNRGDFILWHGDGERGFSWKTDIGRGRPAWNIQDAAMITKDLGWQIDISCGGIDNLWRHHDYTIAVIEGVTGQEFAHYWLHGEHVLADGVKMSKSKGNVIYLEHLLNKGYTSGQVRFFLLTHHYRKKVSLTMKKIDEAAQRLDTLRHMTGEIIKCKTSGRVSGDGGMAGKLTEDFQQRMNDDLDADGALISLERNLETFVRSMGRGQVSGRECNQILRCVRKIDDVLQVLM